MELVDIEMLIMENCDEEDSDIILTYLHNLVDKIESLKEYEWKYEELCK